MSMKPSLRPESGALVVLWWTSPGCISPRSARGSVLGVLRPDSFASRDWVVAVDAGVARTLSMDCGSPTSGVSSRSMRAPSGAADCLRVEDRCQTISSQSQEMEHCVGRRSYSMITRTQGKAVQTTGRHYLLLSVFAQSSGSTTRRSHCKPCTGFEEIAHRTARKMEGIVVDVHRTVR